MKKIKIASLFASIKNGGGIEKVQANLSVALDNIGYDFTHLVMEDLKPNNDYKGHIYSFNMKFILGFGIRKILSLFHLAYKVKQYCKNHHIDVLIGQGDFFFMVSGLSKLLGNRSKLVAVVHTSIGVWHPIIIKIMIFFLKQHNQICMTSKVELETFVNKYKISKSKLTLMYNAVDIDNIIHLSNLSIGNYKNIFNNGKTTFINVARLNYQKNQALLIEAFNKIDNKNTQLIIIGEGNERNNLEKLIVKLGLEDRVLLLGNQENTYSFINLADYWILSSRFEGFPMVLIEAGVLGKTILSLDCPTGPREFLDPFYQLGEIKESYTKSQNGILIRFDESNTIHLTKTMNDIQKMDTTIFQQNVKEYCKSFDLLNYGEKRNIIIQSLV